MARFVPVVRTFAPIVAGVGRMKYSTFLTYNVIGGLLWGVGVTTLGHFLGNVTWVKNNIQLASTGIVILSLLPMIIEFIRHRRSTAKPAAPAAESGPSSDDPVNPRPR